MPNKYLTTKIGNTMKKIIVTLMITGSLYAQDDIILKSAGTDATKGILFQNSNADTLMDIDGDGLISIFGTSNTGAKLRLYASNKVEYLELTSTGNFATGFNWRLAASGTLQLGGDGITNVFTKGTFTIGQITFPNTDGTNGQVLTTDGSGALSWSTVSGASSITGLTDALVEDNSIYVGNDPSSTTSVAESNVGVGINVMNAITTGDYNTAVGHEGMSATTTGEANTAFGHTSLHINTSGGSNTAIGFSALIANTTGMENTAIGYRSGYTVTTGKKNILIGTHTNPNAATGDNQIVIGDGASGHGDNIAVIGNGSATAIHPHDDDEVDLGSSSYEYKDLYVDGTAYLDSIGFGSDKVALPTSKGSSGQVLQSDGSGSLSWTTNSGSGGGSSINDLSDAKKLSNSMFIGTVSSALSEGDQKWNTAAGVKTLESLSTGIANTAFGYWALGKTTTSVDNTAFGSEALRDNTTGDGNTAVGDYSLISNSTGNNNTAVGRQSAKIVTTGENNSVIGSNAGNVLTTGSNNVILGYGADPSAADGTNQIVIGKGAVGAANNTVQLGNTDITNVKTSGTITAGAITIPNTDGSANQVLKTDGSGTLSWTANSGSGGASSITGLSDALVEGNSIYLGNDPSASTDDAILNVAVGTTTLDEVTTGDYNTAVGASALSKNTTGSNNTGLGTGALNKTTTGEMNTAVGSYSLLDNTTGDHNTATGYQALYKSTTGSSNTATGYMSLLEVTTGVSNTAIGYRSGDVLTTGGSNVLVGDQTDPSAAAGTNQIVIGVGATGHGNNIAVIGNGTATAIHPHDDNEVDLGSSSYEYKNLYVDGTAYLDSVGFGTTKMALPTADGSANQVLKTDGSGTLSWTANSGSGASNVTGLSDALIESNSMYIGNDPSGTTSTAEYNLAVGTTALDAITTGDKNTGVGYNALTGVTSGSWNTAVGHEAGKAMTTGADNTAIGLSAGAAITTGTRNIAIGGVALDNVDSENDNLAIGYAALGGAIDGGELNVAIGNYSLDALTTGDRNVGVGYMSLSANTTGYYNTATGVNALKRNTTGYLNVAMGESSLDANTTGNQNVAIGTYSLTSNTTAGGNTAIGSYASYYNTTGHSNVGIGYESLRYNATGSYNVAVGRYSLNGASGNNLSRNTALGHKAGYALATGTDNVILGYEAAAGATDADNQIVIGQGAVGHGDNIAVIGNTDATAWHPADDNGVDLGSSSYEFKDLYLDGTAYTDGLSVDGSVFSKTTVTTKSTAGNVTFTAAEIIGGLIVRDPSGAHRTDVTPTAANIVGAITSPIVGLSFRFHIKNMADAGSEEITLSAGSGVTLHHTRSITIGEHDSIEFLAVLTNVTSGSEAVTIYLINAIDV